MPAALAEAVALAISVVAEERPHTAIELAQLIKDGANGISPYDSEGRPVITGDSDAATRVMRGRDFATQETAVAPAVTPRPANPRATTPRAPRTVAPREVTRAASPAGP